MLNIVNFISSAADTHPKQIALRFNGTAYTYADLNILSARIAAGLHQSGVCSGDRIALYLSNQPAFILCYLGIARLGAIVVSLNPTLKQDEIAYILKNCAASILFTDNEHQTFLPTDITTLDEIILCDGNNNRLAAWMADTSLPSKPRTMQSSDPLAILYTSGTTGFPKGATLSHHNVAFIAKSAMHCCGTTMKDKLLLAVPLSHCFGQNLILNHAFFASATIILIEKFNLEEIINTIEQEQVSMIFTVPTVYSLLLQQKINPKQFQSVRYCHSGAAPLSDELAQNWLMEIGIPIHQGYGLTESAPLASYNAFPNQHPTSIGKAIEQVEIQIVDEERKKTSQGEILIRGPNVMLGYWNDPDATNKAIQDGWLRSGDLGYQDANGNLYIIDRIKDIINISGLKVYPVEVEQVLQKHQAVMEACVFGVPDTLTNERVYAVIVIKPNHHLTLNEINLFCRYHLAPYKMPCKIRIQETIPKSASGKILRRVLRTEAIHWE